MPVKFTVEDAKLLAGVVMAERARAVFDETLAHTHESIISSIRRGHDNSIVVLRPEMQPARTMVIERLRRDGFVVKDEPYITLISVRGW